MMKKIKRPPRFIYYLLCLFILPFFKIKNRVHYHRKGLKKLKGPFVAICNHPSRPDFVYSITALFPRRLNVVVARFYTFHPKLKPILRYVQAIPKNLFNPDSTTVKSIMAIIKQKGAILIMPEGRLSSDGTTSIMPEGIEKLIKKLGVPVVNVHVEGAFLTGGKWIEKRRRGRVDVTASILLTSEEVQSFSHDEIGKRIDQAISYNDYEWLLNQPNLHFRGKDLTAGLDGIIYRCPECHHEFTLVSKNHHFTCQNCGYDVVLSSRYEFESKTHPVYFKNISEWFTYQKECARQDWLTNDFALTTKVNFHTTITTNKKTTLQKVGNGECILDRSGLTYRGTEFDKEVTFHFPLQILPTLLFGCKEDFEVYYDNRFYYFVPETQIEQVVKWSVYTEVAYQLFIEEAKKQG